MKLLLSISIFLTIILFGCESTSTNAEEPQDQIVNWGLTLAVGSIDSMTTLSTFNTSLSFLSNGLSGTIVGYDTTRFQSELSLSINFGAATATISEDGSFTIPKSDISFLQGRNKMTVRLSPKEGYTLSPSGVPMDMIVQ